VSKSGKIPLKISRSSIDSVVAGKTGWTADPINAFESRSVVKPK
jgi:hypothetical protein|tara:strand:+ start:982 stop:1113 length:132 start_codon:yes stop_codon:yes gene_type:complete